MEKCKLCKQKKADKKGSHMVPHFLLKRIENIEGKKKERDYELGFSINGMRTSSHFGRSVQPEKLDEIYGELTEEEIANNNHPLIVDNIFCSDCEERLAKIESEYAKSIDLVEEGEYESGIDTALGLLFWGSILWRMSINGKSGTKLSEEKNEQLRQMLDSFLPKGSNDIDKDTMLKNDFVQSISYKALRYNESQATDSKWLFFHPKFDSTLCLLIDEYAIAYSIGDKFEELEKKDCLGLNSSFKTAPENIIGAKEKLKSLNKEQYEIAKKKLLEVLSTDYNSELSELLDGYMSRVKTLGIILPQDFKKDVIEEVSFGEKKIGRKYVLEDIKKTIQSVLKKYAPQQ